MLCASGFVDDVMISCNRPYGCIKLMQPEVSLHCCAQANTPVVWYWLSLVLDDVRRED